MKNYLELYLTSEATTKEQWQTLNTVMSQQLGMLSRYQIVVMIKDNVVRFFIGADREVSELSNNIEMGVLRPVNASELEIPNKFSRENFVQFVSGGNVLDLKDKMAVKRGRQLEFMVLNVRNINSEKSFVNAELYFSRGQIWTRAKKMFTFFPAQLLAIDFATNTKYLRKSYPKYLSIEKTLNLFESSDLNSLFQLVHSLIFQPLAIYL